ncbi:MAG: CHAT domain-containing protein [Spirochaetota bacterium]
MRIRILNIAPESVDVILDDQISDAVENHKLLPNKLLQEYQDDWLNFFEKVLAEKNSRPSDKAFDQEVSAKLNRYSKTLESLLFPIGFDLSDTKTLVFSVDANWVRLPFELLPTHNNPQDFIGLKVPILRQIRTIKTGAAEANQSKKNGKRFLLLANPEGSADLTPMTDAEKKSLEGIAGKATQLKALGKLASTAQILEELVHCRYLHYSGHVREQSLQFNQARLKPTDISALNLENMELAFVNGCNSASRHDGLVQAFLSAGVKNYIGYNHKISDQVALFAADFVWRSFFQSTGKLKKLSGLFGFENKGLAEVSLLLRQQIFKKFGAAELAWLNIQFFINLERSSKKRSSLRLLPAAMVSGAVALLAAIIWKTAWNPAKSPGESIPNKVTESPPTTIRKSKPSKITQPDIAYQKPVVPESRQQRESPPPIDSPVLADLVASFRKTPHPYYTKEDKERILSEVLHMSVSESAKITRLRNEMP